MASFIHTETPAELFRRLVAEAVDRQDLNPSRASRRYLVQLLAGFVRPERLYARADIEPDRPLAEIFLTAISSDGMRQFTLFKLSGDLALLVSGVFSDSLKGQPADVDYYGQLGGCAYATVAMSCHSPEGARVFGELAANFGSFVDVLSEVSEGCGLTDRSDVLRLYERWSLTGSRRCAAALRTMGAPPGLGSELAN